MILLYCDSCGRRMRRLEPSKIIDERYLCIPCATEVENKKKQEEAIKKIYDQTDGIPYIGFCLTAGDIMITWSDQGDVSFFKAGKELIRITTDKETKYE